MKRFIELRDIAILLYWALPLSYMLALGSWQGRLQCRTNSHLKKSVRGNIQKLFAFDRTSDEVDVLTRHFFEHLGARRMLQSLLPFTRKEKLEAILKVENLEKLDSALSRGKGVVLVGSHLNSAVVFPTIFLLREIGYDVRLVFPTTSDPFAPSAFGSMLMRMRKAQGLLSLAGAFHSQFNIRPIMKCLAEGGIPVLLGDGTHSASFARVPFLGERTCFTTANASIARTSGSVLLPFFCTGDRQQGYVSHIGDIIQVERSDSSRRDIERAAEQYAAQLEDHVKAEFTSWQHLEFKNILKFMNNSAEKSMRERIRV